VSIASRHSARSEHRAASTRRASPRSHGSIHSTHQRLPTQRRPCPAEAPFREPENGLRSYSRCARSRGEYGCAWATNARRTDAPVVVRSTRITWTELAARNRSARFPAPRAETGAQRVPRSKVLGRPRPTLRDRQPCAHSSIASDGISMSAIGESAARAAVGLASADDRRRSTPTHREAGTRPERFLAATSHHVIRAVLKTPCASVRLADVVLTIS